MIRSSACQRGTLIIPTHAGTRRGQALTYTTLRDTIRVFPFARLDVALGDRAAAHRTQGIACFSVRIGRLWPASSVDFQDRGDIAFART